MPKDDLAQIRGLRDHLRALKAPYPALTRPAAKRCLEDYLSTQEETPMPAKGDRTHGEDLVNVTFKVQASVMDTVEKHLRMLQRMTRYQRIGKSDVLRDIFLRGIDSIENPPQPSPMALDAAELSTPPPVEPEPSAPAYEARAQEDDLEDMPLDPRDMTQESAVPAAPAAGGDIPPDLAPEVPPRGEPDWSLGSTWAQAFAARPLQVTQESPAPAAPAETVTPPRSGKAARPKAAAKPKPRTARTPKGRK